jgi:hypothetical protein
MSGVMEKGKEANMNPMQMMKAAKKIAANASKFSAASKYLPLLMDTIKTLAADIEDVFKSTPGNAAIVDADATDAATKTDAAAAPTPAAPAVAAPVVDANAPVVVEEASVASPEQVTTAVDVKANEAGAGADADVDPAAAVAEVKAEVADVKSEVDAVAVEANSVAVE